MDFDDYHYDQPIKGPHFICTTQRRFLINFPVDPQVLEEYLLPNTELKIKDDVSWVTACCVSLKKMRPWFLPKIFGISFNYVVLRTRAKLTFPDNKTREIVLVLQTNVSKRISKWVGNLLFKMDFNHRIIEIDEENNQWNIKLKDNEKIKLDIEIPKHSFSTEPQPDSKFENMNSIEDYFINVSYGAKYKDNKVVLFPESREPWDIETTSVKFNNDELIQDLLHIKPKADHSITVGGFQHYYYWKSTSWDV